MGTSAAADARYCHRRALSAPTRVVDMSARYIPLAVSTTPSQCRQRAPTPASCPCTCQENARGAHTRDPTPHIG
ncbi:hypothetical protein HMPREF1550_00233 [Actinomyces sp. oral taxon 877 str. F0543]|nr:hypothetical protein HMPREF1550_00233 [Actinomyces sp. oral taxon 877 str. F0543]